MKLFCKENHWKIKDGKLHLGGNKEDQRKVAIMEAVLETKIRAKIYGDICNLKLTENRKAIAKAGIDNVALTVQALCADVAIGYPTKKEGKQ